MTWGATMIYLDHNATTQPDPRVREAVARTLAEHWGNPSAQHALGQDARALLVEARAEVAGLAGVAATDVVFTSGGTESVCQVLLGGDALSRPRHLITSSVEHPCVLSAADALEAAGWHVTRLPVDGRGVVDPAAVRAALTPETALVSIMLANNDTGVLQPVAAIAEIAREAGIPMHTDAVQAAGRIPVDATALGVDFLTLSGHKFHGPKGSGAIACASARRPGALLRGGSQEQGLRAGTENVPALVGMGVAARLARQGLDSATPRLLALRDRLEQGLLGVAPDAVVHAAGTARLPNTLNIAFPGTKAYTLAARLDLEGIAVSTTSACATGSDQPPHVLVAMGVPPSLALASVRFSLGKDNTADEVDAAIACIAALLPEARQR